MRIGSITFRNIISGAVATAIVVVASAMSVLAQQGTTRFELAPTGNEARYRVQEQFLGVDFPNEAVGRTSSITGAIVLDAAGKVVPAQSRFTVDVTTLKSDQDGRDRQVQGRLLETAQFPKVEIAVKELRGFTYPIPASGEMKFELIGDLTIHGVTRPATWQVTASPKTGGLAGTATTAFKFTEFGMPQPQSMRLLSVEDNGKLEYEFNLVKK